MGDDNRTTRFLDRVSSGFARLAESRWGSRSAIAVACLVACFPAIDNGFISDDYVHLEWAELLLTDPVYLFGTPPIGFRPTSFIAYLGLKKVFGHSSPFYYLFSIGVHFITCLLVVALARFVTEDDRIAFWSGMLFAVIYQAQEAVFYIAAMNESLMVLFGASSILLYLRRRYTLCVLTYSLALLSKEAAVVIPVLALLVEYGILRKRPFHAVRLLVFAGPAAVRLGFFLYYRAENYYVTEGIHALTPALFGVLLLSLFKLTFPWLPLLLIAPLSRLALGRSPGGEPLVSTGQSSGFR